MKGEMIRSRFKNEEQGHNQPGLSGTCLMGAREAEDVDSVEHRECHSCILPTLYLLPILLG
jgi:hypothetical protein